MCVCLPRFRFQRESEDQCCVCYAHAHAHVHAHLHSGQVAAVGSSKPAISGALVDINILEINVHSHHAPATQEASVNLTAST